MVCAQLKRYKAGFGCLAAFVGRDEFVDGLGIIDGEWEDRGVALRAGELVDGWVGRWVGRFGTLGGWRGGWRRRGMLGVKGGGGRGGEGWSFAVARG